MGTVFFFGGGDEVAAVTIVMVYDFYPELRVSERQTSHVVDHFLRWHYDLMFARVIAALACPANLLPGTWRVCGAFSPTRNKVD